MLSFRISSLLLVAIAGFLCQTISFGEITKPTVQTEQVKPKELSDNLIYPATLSAYRVVPIHSDTEGLVSELRVVLGQRVQKGTTLLAMKNPDPVYNFQPHSVIAPFSGVITSIDIAVGDRVIPARALMVLADLSSLKVKINLTAQDIEIIDPKEQGFLQLGEKRLPVQIKAMSPMIDPGTGTASCELELSGKAPPLAGLIPGSIGKVVFETNKRIGVTVTERAVVYKGKDSFIVRVTDKKKAQYVPIKIIKHAVGSVEISSALKDGDTIVTGSTGFIIEGEELNVEAKDKKKGPPA